MITRRTKRFLMLLAASLCGTAISVVYAPAAQASGGGIKCFRSCVGQIILDITGESDYVASVRGAIQLVGPPPIKNARMHIKFEDHSGKLIFERWHTFPGRITGVSDVSWKIGGRFGAGKMCAIGYEGPNKLAEACGDVKV